MSQNNFYFNIEQHGNKIFHRYWDSVTKTRQTVVVDRFKIELFQPTRTKTGYVGLHNENLGLIEFDNIKEAKEYIDNYSAASPIYGQEQFVYQFIRQKYKEDIVFDINKFNIANWDIETAFGESQYKGDHKIEISLKDNFYLGDDGVYYKNDPSIKTTKTLIENFIKTDTDKYLVFDEEIDQWKEWSNTCYTFTEGFPTPEKANQEILAITIKLLGKKHKFVCFYLKEYTKEKRKDVLYVKCDNEKALLLKFLDVWEKLDIDILTGYFIEGFDIPYVVNRIKNILGETHANRLSPLSRHIKNPLKEGRAEGGRQTYTILGLSIYDYLTLYKKFSGKTLTSYKLDAVASEELGENKLEYEGTLMDLYNNDFDRYLEYNIQDTYLVERLEDKLKFILLGVTLAFLNKSRIGDIFSPVRLWECAIYNKLADSNICIPPKKKSKLENSIAGGYVKEPELGYHPWVVTVDATSLNRYGATA